MGLGKSCVALTAFVDLQANFDAHKMLVIGPKRVAGKVWSDEIKEWSHLSHLSVSRIVGDAGSCFDALRQPADVYTIGRDRVPWLHAQFVRDGKQVVEWPFDWVIPDEAQSFANQSSKRFGALLDLRIKTRFPRFTELSGTPMPNGYMNLWSQLYLLDRGRRLGKSENWMKQRWFTPPTGMFAQWQLRRGAEEEIHNALRDIVLVLREEDYLDLPPVQDNFIRCELSAPAMATYRKFEREYIAEVAGRRLTAVNSGVLDGKLLQLANGACYTGQDREWVPFHDAKLEALAETLEGFNGRKTLIAYGFQHDKVRIAGVLDKQAKEEGRTWRLLDSDRDFQEWADGKIDWGLLHPASAGHGLNDVYKSGAEDLVFFGLTNNLEYYQQVRARLEGGHRRMGRNVRIHHIVADGTRDDDYVALIKRKALTQNNAKAALATRIQK
jgi:SNF2-related domain